VYERRTAYSVSAPGTPAETMSKKAVSGIVMKSARGKPVIRIHATTLASRTSGAAV